MLAPEPAGSVPARRSGWGWVSAAAIVLAALVLPAGACGGEPDEAAETLTLEAPSSKPRRVRPADAVGGNWLVDRGFPTSFPLPPESWVVSFRGYDVTGFDIIIRTTRTAGELQDYFTEVLGINADWGLVELESAYPLPVLDDPWMPHITDAFDARMSHVRGPYNGMVNVMDSDVHMVLWATSDAGREDILALLPDPAVLPLPAADDLLAAYGDTGREVGRIVLVYRTGAAVLDELVAAYEALGHPVNAAGEVVQAQVGQWKVELSVEPVPDDPGAAKLTVRLSEQYRFGPLR
ncbi:MAG: hypothetical protein J4F99_04730 [Acidimicrobiia bacterium]|nr:hypothetical protein [Acidimicrobiia bacterium]